MERKCKKCGVTQPLDNDHFGHQPNGSYRWTCRRCMAARTEKHNRRNWRQTVARAKRRQCQIAEAPGYWTESDISLIREAQQDQCYFCGESIGMGGEIDHLTPVSRGGTHWPENLALTCETCNRNKHAKTEEEFWAWRRKHGLPLGYGIILREIPVCDALFISVDDLPADRISVRARSCLRKAGVEFLGDLIEYTSRDLLRLSHIKRGDVLEIEEILETHGLSLGSKATQWSTRRPSKDT